MNTARLFLLTLAAPLFAGISAAAQAVWDGGGGPDNRWSTAANWAGDVLPAPSDTVVFGAGIPSGGVNLDGGRTVAELIFDTPDTVSISGGTLTLSSGNIRITNNGIASKTITAPLVLGNAAAVFDLAAQQNLHLDGGVTAAGPLTLTGTGTLHLGSNLSCSGAFTLSQGSLNLSGHTCTAASLTLSGTVSDYNFPPGELRTGGNIATSQLLFMGWPVLVMEPATAEAVTILQGAPITGLGRFVKNGQGSTALHTRVTCQDFDLAGGALDLYGDSTLRVAGTARLRAGTVLYDLAASGGTLQLLGNARLIQEGAEMVYDPSITISNASGENVTLTGTAPLTGLLLLSMPPGNAGSMTLDGIDVSARMLTLNGTVDLNGRTLTSTQPGWTTALAGTLTDSGNTGTLRVAGTFQNNNALFTSGPALAMRPAAGDQVISVQGAVINGLGKLLVENAGSVVVRTEVNTTDFDLAGGSLDLNGAPWLRVSGTARLRAGTALYDYQASNAGTLLLRNNARLIHEGAEMLFTPDIAISNLAGQNVTIGGTAPLTGLGSFTMPPGNPGSVTLDGIDVSARQLLLNGIVNLNGCSLEATQPGGTTSLSGTLTDSSIGGTLRLAGNLQNNSATFTSEPTLAMRPAAPDQVIAVQGANISGLGTLLIENAGSVVIRTQVDTRDFDLAGGSLDLNGNTWLRVTGTARLRAGTALYDYSASNTGALQLRGNARLIQEGAEMTFTPDISISNTPGQNVTLSGTAPLSGLGSFVIVPGNPGTVTLGGIDVSARLLLLNGTVNLNGRVLESTLPGGTTQLSGTLTDSTTGGTLRLAGNLQNNGAVFTSEPVLAMRPAAGDQVISVQGSNISGLGTLVVENAGSVVIRTQVDTINFDLAGGSLDLNGSPWLRVTGTARLRAGTALYDFTGSSGGTLLLRGNARLIQEGAEMLYDPDIGISNNAGENVTLGGTAPLTALGALSVAPGNQGTVTLDGIDVSARQLHLNGTVDLKGRILTSTQPNWTTSLNGTLADSGITGTLRLTGSLTNNNAGFVSLPNLEFVPGFLQFTGFNGSALTGIGCLTVAGDPAGLVSASTSINVREFDLVSGTFNLSNTGHTFVSHQVWLRGNAYLYSGGTGGVLTLLDNCQVHQEGAVMDAAPGFLIFNAAGQTIGFHGPLPLTGVGPVYKYGFGAVALDTPVQASHLWLEGGSLDLNGKAHVFTGSGGGTQPESVVLSAGTVLCDSTGNGSISLGYGLRNRGATVQGMPDLILDPPAPVDAGIAGEPVTGFDLVKKTGAGNVRQSTSLHATRLEVRAGRWSPQSSLLSLSNGVLVNDAAIDRTNSSLEGMLELTGGHLEITGANGSVDVPQLRIATGAGVIKLLGEHNPLAVRVTKSGTGTLDLNGHTLHTRGEFILEDGLLRDSSAEGTGQILYPQIPEMTPRFLMHGGDVDVLVQGSPQWFKHTAGAATVIRGHLDENGDYFAVAEGNLQLQLDTPEKFNVGYLVVGPSAVLSGRARYYDGNVSVSQGGRLRPEPAPGSFTFGNLSFEESAILELPLRAGTAPLVVPPGDYLGLPDTSPAGCVLVQVTGAAVAGTTFDLFTWAGAQTEILPELSRFQLLGAPPGYLKLNANGDTLQFVATANSGWDAWRAEHFTPAELADDSISGPAADPDHDSLDNLTEYVLGALPKSADGAGRFDTTLTDLRGKQVLSFRFTVSRTATDVRVEPETATGFDDWQPAFLEPVGEKTETTVTWLAWTPVSGERRQFRVAFRR